MTTVYQIHFCYRGLTVTGQVGSCHDMTCLKRSDLWSKFESRSGRMFRHGEYLLTDSAYTPSPFLVPAYRSSTTTGNKDKEDFNLCLAHVRVLNEHCIGVLKSRWFSLRELRIQLKEEKDNYRLVKWIGCCIMLHNFLIDRLDEWSEEDSEILLDTEDQQSYLPTDRTIGLELRNRVQTECLRINRLDGGFLNR